MKIFYWFFLCGFFFFVFIAKEKEKVVTFREDFRNYILDTKNHKGPLLQCIFNEFSFLVGIAQDIMNKSS